MKTTAPKVAVLMGSASDKPIMAATFDLLNDFGVPFVGRILSAHRTPEATATFVGEAEAAGAEVFICGAGMAAHLAGVVASHTAKPVLAVPLASGGLGGLDALLSSVQMPGGVPVATFAVGKAGAKNAALFAVQILSGSDPKLATAVVEFRREQAEKVLAADAELGKELR